jgi:hypothetical protein
MVVDPMSVDTAPEALHAVDRVGAEGANAVWTGWYEGNGTNGWDDGALWCNVHAPAW